MNPKLARLIKKSCDDGLMEMADHVPLGKDYIIDADSVRTIQGLNTNHNVTWEREMVQDVKTGEWLPTELLYWEGKNK